MKSFELFSAGEEIILLKKSLNDIMGSDLDLDPILDIFTQSVLLKYQLTQGIFEHSRHGAVYGPQTQEALLEHISEHYITQSLYAQYSKELEINSNVLECAVKSCAVGGALSKVFKIKFNKNLFYRFIAERVSIHEAIKLASIELDLCSSTYESDLKFISFKDESLKLDRALQYYDFAYECANYGIFQLCGSDWSLTNAKSAYDLYTTSVYSEKLQFEHLMTYIKNNSALLECLRTYDLAGFIRRYHSSSAVTNGLVDHTTTMLALSIINP